jgi:SAM-dependent methyltransferase
MSQNAHERLRQFWDLDADVYDRSPTHAGTEPIESAVWRAALLRHLPPPPAEVLDVGAGTGAISLLLAELGFQVTALDLSSAMLAKAIEKAAMRGLEIQTWVAPATEPPPGRFDAVVERHLLWTLPDPVAALSAWRSVAPRLVSYEGIWHRTGPIHRVRRTAGGLLRTLRKIPDEHHGSYEPDLQASLPLAKRMGPGALIETAGAAGWRRGRIERLRDVEWARRLASPSALLGWLEAQPHFALIAEA